MKRRDFLKAIAALTACGSVGRVVGASSGKRATDRIVLGPRQISVSRMFRHWHGRLGNRPKPGIGNLRLAALLVMHPIRRDRLILQINTHPSLRS
jgi:hypothetical protein